MSTQRPVIIVGCPRSGTTLLQLMVHAHPRIAVAPETRFVLEGFARRNDFRDLGDARRRAEVADWIVRRRGSRFRDLGLDPDVVRAEILAAAPTLGSAFAAVFRCYAEHHGKQRWGDKRPSYLQHMDAIERLFPRAQIVHIIRDGRDCVASLKEMHWYRREVVDAVANWNRSIDFGHRAARRWGPDGYTEVRYEELVTDPERELRRLCAFLGEAYDDAMTRPAEQADTIVPDRKTWHERTRSAVTTARVGSWSQRLDPDEVAVCEAAMGRRLRLLGYPVSGTARPSPARRAEYLATALRGSTLRARQAGSRALDRARRTPDLAARPEA